MWLLHGTTMHRAERIVHTGPDVAFVEPGGGTPAENISFCVEGHASMLGQAEQYAALKAGHFPAEGGAVLVSVDVPERLVLYAAEEYLQLFGGLMALGPLGSIDEVVAACGGVIQFDPGPALSALLAAWTGLEKEIREVP